jgi:hypothetical protein
VRSERTRAPISRVRAARSAYNPVGFRRRRRLENEQDDVIDRMIGAAQKFKVEKVGGKSWRVPPAVRPTKVDGRTIRRRVFAGA